MGQCMAPQSAVHSHLLQYHGTSTGYPEIARCVTCCWAMIRSLSGEKRTWRGHRKSVAPAEPEVGASFALSHRSATKSPAGIRQIVRISPA
jgi:hypothetical protein